MKHFLNIIDKFYAADGSFYEFFETARGYAIRIGSDDVVHAKILSELPVLFRKDRAAVAADFEKCRESA